MYLLGISAFYHDSAAVIICDGFVVAAAQEERFTRVKSDPSFPVNAISFCLDEAGILIDDLESIVYYEKPFLKFERLLETYLRFAPKGIVSFLKAIPVWLKQKLFIKKTILDGLKKVGEFDRRKVKLLFSEHHLSHAASAFFTSPYSQAAVLTIDGVGEWATTTIFSANGNQLTCLKEIHFPDSIGLLYSCFTYFLGFRVNSGEYKVMGLAPYGVEEDLQTKNFISIIKSKIVIFLPDGSFHIAPSMVTYATGDKMINDRQWTALFGFPPRKKESAIELWHCNLALAIQTVIEECVGNLAREAKKITGCRYLCLSGGVALNCVSNSYLLKQNVFADIYIQPAAGDAGGALGAALAAYYIYFGASWENKMTEDRMRGTFLGPSYSEKEILKAVNYHKLKYSVLSENEIVKKTAQYISEGLIVGWFQGKMEFGPRALGNRSILADPRNQFMQQNLNLKIKFREEFRPFAPSVKEEEQSVYFDPAHLSPYMTWIDKLKVPFLHVLPQDFDSLTWQQKQSFEKSVLPGVTHANGTARVQTVSKATNPLFWNLLDKFQQITGYPILINTSFNVRSEPIVCCPEDAIFCFVKTEMDVLVMGNLMVLKKYK